MTQTQTIKKETATDAYIRNTIEARELVASIASLLEDTLCPSEDFTPNWAHVGDLAETVSRLKAVQAFLDRTEGRSFSSFHRGA